MRGARDDEREQWRRAALIVWPSLGKKGEDFSKYLRRIGLSEEKKARPPSQREIERARELGRQAREELARQERGG